MKTPKINEKLLPKVKNWKGNAICTTATDIVEPRTSDI
jgi:hypothetical protein